MSVAASVSRIIDDHGEAMTLQRVGETDLSVKGKRVPGVIVETGGTAVQQEFRVRLSPTQLAASAWTVKEPTRTDRIIIDGRTRSVLDVQPLGDGGGIACWMLTVAG